MGPTPPGTGVIRQVGSSALKSASPWILPSMRVNPTSIIVTQWRTMSFFISPGCPAAMTMISAVLVNSSKFRVSLLHTVTVPPAFMRRRESGFPTILLFPTITIFSPCIFTLVSFKSLIIPLGVQEISSAVPRKSFPIFWLVKPSTSFCGSITSIMLFTSI